jgi:3-deoxy-D-manno-octulosonate 8-phosphate phosphatase (KDO 8-P phosphatase)
MGDDVNDVAALAIVGLSAVPSDAQPAARRWASFVSKFPGGNGAVRELVDSILSHHAPVRSAKSA